MKTKKATKKPAKKAAKKVSTKESIPAKESQIVKAPTKNETKKETTRDTTTYKFNGEPLGKGRFVLAVVQAWAKAHKSADAKKLEEVFPHSLIHRYGVVAPLKEAQERSKDRKRYFIEESEIVEVGGKKYAVCNQITGDIVTRFIEHCKKGGMQVK